MLNRDFENVVSPAAGATEVAQDSFANSLVAYRPVSGGHTTVGVTAYVGRLRCYPERRLGQGDSQCGQVAD